VIRLALRVRREHAELVLAELLDLAPAGVEEVEVGDGVVEYAVYGAPGELPELPDLQAAAGHALVEVSTSELPDDWSERWRSFHRPVEVAAPPGQGHATPSLRVRPPWEPAKAAGGVLDIVIDPGQAFGTGAHATTRLCLELLLELAATGGAHGPLLDVGCGSGVLAIAAARLGWSPVIGLDHERESVQATEDNAAANGVSLEVRRFDLRHEAPPSAPVVVANLLRPLLLELAHRVAEPPEHLIAGGLLEPEADEVARAFAQTCGLGEQARRGADGWCALWLAGR
jgi:ribosomal protein L11 methyltransferase